MLVLKNLTINDALNTQNFLKDLYVNAISQKKLFEKYKLGKNYFCDGFRENVKVTTSPNKIYNSIFFAKYSISEENDKVKFPLEIKDVKGYLFSIDEEVPNMPLLSGIYGQFSEDFFPMSATNSDGSKNENLVNFKNNLTLDYYDSISSQKKSKDNKSNAKIIISIYEIEIDIIKLSPYSSFDTKKASFKNKHFKYSTFPNNTRISAHEKSFDDTLKAVKVFEELVNDLIGKELTEQQPQPIISNDLPKELQEALEEMAKEEGQGTGTEIGEIKEEQGEEGGEGGESGEGGEEGGEGGESRGEGGEGGEEGVMGALNKELNEFLDTDLGEVEKHLNSKQIKRTFITRENVENAIGFDKIFGTNNKERIDKVLDKIFK